MSDSDYIRPRMSLYHTEVLIEVLDKALELKLSNVQRSAALMFRDRLEELVVLYNSRQTLRDIRAARDAVD